MVVKALDPEAKNFLKVVRSTNEESEVHDADKFDYDDHSETIVNYTFLNAQCHFLFEMLRC